MLHRRTFSIQRQLLLLVLALGLPFLAFLLITTSRQASHDRAQAGQQMLGTARVTAARLDDHIGDILQVLNVLSTTVGTTPQDTALNDTLLLGLAGRLPGEISNIAVWTPDGRNIGTLQPDVRGAVVGERQRRSFEEGLARNGLVVTAPVTSMANGAPMAVFSVRIERGGQVAGLVTIASELTGLQSLLAPGGYGPPGSVITVTGSDGIVVARSLKPEEWIGRSLTVPGAPSVPGPDGAAARGGLQPGEGVWDGPSADGVRRIAGYATAKRLPWQVYVGVPEDAAMEPVRTRLHESLMAGAAMLAIGLLLSALVARRISLPLRRLAQDAGALGRGDLAHRSTAAGPREVNALSTRLNEMAEAIQQRNARLQASEQELSDLYENAPCGYLTLDAEGRFVRINATALRWVDCARDEVIGHSLPEFLTAEGRELFAAKLPELLAHGETRDLEFELVGKQDGARRVLASAVAVRDGEGRVLSIRAVLYDITELAKMRGDLQRLGEEEQAILDTDLIGFVKFAGGRVTWANAGAARMFDYPLDAFIGLPSRVLHASDEAFATTEAQAARAVAAGATYRHQLQLVRRQGEARWFDLIAIGLPTSPGATMVMLQDITLTREAEQTRVHALLLEAQNRELAESSRLKSQFLANMSHELRTPLNGILGMAYLMGTDPAVSASPKLKGHLGQIDRSGKQLLSLIEAMLNMANIESGKLDLAPERLSLRAVCAQVVTLLQADAERRQVDVQVEVAPEVDEVTADATRLTQVVAAYVSNAIKFCEPGGHVRVTATAQGHGMFRIEVADDGIGIAEADFPRLFVAFQQLSEGSRKAYQGVGLGLALVKRLVEAQGGSVGVRSVQGQGSVFHLVLPTRG
ncbi:ATP-binding protein [Pseudorhodoferax sp. Leaf274]|uniref:ATP-binding protein n=1 Tax=Pseudorhodoferax sp. Leaf274 TaxID=1736318 RepID=UPI0007039031|nr:ATP-binding protein [Pseudorhodoferax sp. Leaf274]KQP35481.1 hypothetical protein ASF44_19290 [Pseudorhodoferax sp. Leaf274]